MSYVTHDSGERAEYDSGMVRDTQEGKPRFDLMWPLEPPLREQMLTRLAMLLTRGAVKYGERNWEKAESLEEHERFRGSAMRHFMQWFCDEDDGEDHAAAVMFNLIAAETTAWKLVERVPTGDIKWDWLRPAEGVSPLGPNELLVNMEAQ